MKLNKTIFAWSSLAALAVGATPAEASERITMSGLNCVSSYVAGDGAYQVSGAGALDNIVMMMCPLPVMSDDSRLTDVDLWTSSGVATHDVSLVTLDRDGDFLEFYQPSRSGSGDLHFDWGELSIPNQGVGVIIAYLEEAQLVYSYSVYDSGVTF